jgi:HEAT repeat protein
MSLETALSDLTDPTKNITSKQLVDLSGLDAEEQRALADVWASLDPSRRMRTVNDLIDLVQDNVELNFDAVFKTALADEEALVRAGAIRGLYEYEGRDLISPLINMLRTDEDAEVRREAAMALGRYALAAELGYLYERDARDLRSTLIESAEDLDEDERVRARALEALGAISGEETDNLIESIYDEDSLWLKVGAVDAMGRSANDDWLPIILREMNNRAPEMRHAAAFAAGEIGEEQAIQPLKQLILSDPDAEVQRVAIHALSEIGGPQASVTLKSLLYEGDDDLREALEEAINELTFQENPLSPPL